MRRWVVVKLKVGQKHLLSFYVRALGLPRYNFTLTASWKCLIKNCKTCEFSNNRTFINLTNNFILPISENTSCNSKNVIYIIFCSFCNTFYLGQSNCLKDRIYSHIYDIRKFKYPFKEFKSVAVHFNLKYHDYKKHFSFFVLRKDLENLDNR